MTYQATFRQPRKHLNPAGIKIAADIGIEVFQVGVRPIRWKARYIGGTNLKWETKTDIEAPLVGVVKATVRELFEEQITDWQEILTEGEKNIRREVEKKKVGSEGQHPLDAA